MARLKDMQVRNLSTNLETREEEEGDIFLEGYFVVFNKVTELWPGAFEEIDPGALNETLDNDIRCLINHETTLVLGRNKSNTLELEVDSKGLFARVKINKNDTDAMNLYERVSRGDVSGNSFGFNIVEEDVEYGDDDSIKWTIKKIDLHEVSVTTFPQYEETSIEARRKNFKEDQQRKINATKNKLKERLDKIC